MIDRNYIEIGHRPFEKRNGKYISIGLIDSVFDLPTDWVINIDEKKNFIANDRPDTTAHGTKIANILTGGAPEATYNLYRVVTSHKEFKVSNYLKGLDAARQNNVDVINSSAGIHHENCQGNCRISEAAKALVDEGISIVAGAGNAFNSDQHLYCPGKVNQTISVGVAVSYCRFNVAKTATGPVGFDKQLYPPGSYFAPIEAEDIGVNGPFCGGMGCTPVDSCGDNKNEEIWNGNPIEGFGDIDVFAPGTTVYSTQDGPKIDIGTSFSTAYITGVIADILSEIHGKRPLPKPREIKSVLSEMPYVVSGTNKPKFNGKFVFRRLLK